LNESLEILIAFYEEEKKHLHNQIEDCLKEWEYEFAHYHSQALYQVNARLNTLYSLQDRKHGEKVLKKVIISNLEDKFQSESDGYMLEYLSQRLTKEKELLNELNLVCDPVKDPYGNTFDETLDLLLEKRIKQFLLHFDQDEKFLIEFSYKARILKASIPFIKSHLGNMLLTEENLTVLEKMGFEYNNNSSRLTLCLQGSRESITYEIKWRLAKIVFELFHFDSFVGKSYIEIKGRTK